MKEAGGPQDQKDRWSKRAEILGRVLDWVNQERFEDHATWMLFGGMASEPIPAEVIKPDELRLLGYAAALSPRWSAPKSEKLESGLAEFKRRAGRVLDSMRTSLEGPQDPRRLEEDFIRLLVEFGFNVERDLAELLSKTSTSSAPDMRALAEFLDAKFSDEVVGKLERIVERAALVNPHEVNTHQIHDPSFRSCFGGPTAAIFMASIGPAP